METLNISKDANDNIILTTTITETKDKKDILNEIARLRKYLIDMELKYNADKAKWLDVINQLESVITS